MALGGCWKSLELAVTEEFSRDLIRFFDKIGQVALLNFLAGDVVNRFLAGLLLGGLLVAGGANAAVLSTVTNSAQGCDVTSLSGNVGDTFTFINNFPIDYRVGGSGTISPSLIPPLATINPVTLLTPGTVQVPCGFIVGNTLTITIAAAPAPAPIPTLSEWAKISMMLLMILTVGWYGRRLKQR